MSYPIVGFMAALWLIVAPLLGIETGFRAGVSVLCGAAAILLALVSIWRFAAGIGLAVVALVLQLVNLLVAGTFGGVASFAFCTAALAVAGMAPHPRVTAAPASHHENTPISHEPPALAA